MPDTVAEIEKLLKAPFPALDIEWRSQKTGKTSSGDVWALMVPYVDNRAIQDRLDNIFGIDGWNNDFKPVDLGGFLCGIQVRIGDDWHTKWDGASATKVEPIKGGLSDSMKRAAVQWGIGRYLYNLEPTFVTLYEKQSKAADELTVPFKEDGVKFAKRMYCRRPKLPEWALPEEEKPKSPGEKSLEDQKEMVDTVNSIMSDDKPTFKQLGLIRKLSKEKNMDPDLVEERIKQLKTSKEADEAIKKLNELS